ncbi:MAG TPA: NADH:flavin oxidoreductase [Caulobacter sp.]|nr:NADH:flavin oxidoreductase [Caulobacter sp.]
MNDLAALFQPLTFAHGPAMKNRLMLAPLTNLQSHADGTMSEDEFNWLVKRAEGGFGLTMTCAAHVQRIGQGFPGQLGIWSDDHLPGLTRLAAAIKANDSIAIVQLHHAGMRSPAELIGEAPVCPSENAEFGARALTGQEVEQLRDDFIAAALRARAAGFDGVELHGAHGYVLCQFLSAGVNQRTDQWGGSLENRTRIVREILSAVRERCGPDFIVGVRLSPERFDLKLPEIRRFAGDLMLHHDIDFLDMSLWDVGKAPVDPEFQERSLLDWFTDLPRGACRLGVAGKIMDPAQAAELLGKGVDYVLLGRAAILHHDWPLRAAAEDGFKPVGLPVTRAYLAGEGLGPAFQDYMAGWKGFVAEEAA